MYTYTKEIAFTAEAAGYTCIELPALAQGVLHKLTIVSQNETRQETQFRVFTRRGACRNAVDYHVPNGNFYLPYGFTENADFPDAAILKAPTGSKIKVGDSVWIKGTGISGLDEEIEVEGISEVPAVFEEGELTAQAYLAVAITREFGEVAQTPNPLGVWQLKPELPQFQINVHELYMLLGVNTIPSETGILRLNDLNAIYENRDNQGVFDQRRRNALYLEFYTGTNDAGDVTNWVASVTTLDKSID